MSESDEQEDLLAQLEELLVKKRKLLAAIDIKIAKLANGLPAEESTDE